MCSIENQDFFPSSGRDSNKSHHWWNVKLVSLEQDNDPDGYLSTIERATMAFEGFSLLETHDHLTRQVAVGLEFFGYLAFLPYFLLVSFQRFVYLQKMWVTKTQPVMGNEDCGHCDGVPIEEIGGGVLKESHIDWGISFGTYFLTKQWHYWTQQFGLDRLHPPNQVSWHAWIWEVFVVPGRWVPKEVGRLGSCCLQCWWCMDPYGMLNGIFFCLFFRVLAGAKPGVFFPGHFWIVFLIRKKLRYFLHKCEGYEIWMKFGFDTSNGFEIRLFVENDLQAFLLPHVFLIHESRRELGGSPRILGDITTTMLYIGGQAGHPISTNVTSWTLPKVQGFNLRF